MELFAANPDIVHPVSIDCDAQGRLLVIESHTHFPPQNYQGPKHDRIRRFEDTKGTGKADRITTFFEGTDMTMDIARHPDSSIYLATRNEILRLRDTKGVGQADEKERIVFLDTVGRYPHNGLSGLCFDSTGNLFFGMGENLGADYKLIGSDGTTLTGGGEGGNIFWCTAYGKRLRRVATAFWNPFGICRDVFGRIFAVDNDPDEMPPCRMLHVVEGGDYGYQFRYGRSGRHIFQAWNGELPGTLPYVTGVGEAPCEVICYESDGLPSEYLGDLLVASWADHRIERYRLKERGASFTAERLPFIQGGKDFRPVGIAVAPDGSLFVSDWVLSDYNLHGRGAIWHIRWKDAGPRERPTDPRKALFSAHRPLREAAAQQLVAEGDRGRDFLRQQLSHDNPRVRAAALTALIDCGDRQMDKRQLAGTETMKAIRDMVPPHPHYGKDQLLKLLDDSDPFLRHVAVHHLAHHTDLLAGIESKALPLQQRLGVLLAWRTSGDKEAARRVADFLADPHDEVRFLAAKWIADERLTQYRPQLVELLHDPKLSVRFFQAYTTVIARIDNQDVNEAKMADFVVARLAGEPLPPATRIMLLRISPAKHPKLTIDLLHRFLTEKDAGLQLETVRVLNEHSSPQRFAVLHDVAMNTQYDDQVRADAVMGLAERALVYAKDFLALVECENSVLAKEALRGLMQMKLTEHQRDVVAALGKQDSTKADLAARVLGRPFHADRPKPENIDAWLKRLEGRADPNAGRRVFFHPQLAGCFRCHRIDGRGQDVGPDLSTIFHTERRQILESILQPSNNVAPRFQSWLLETSDGRVRTGMLHRTVLDEYTYVDEKGALFTLNTRNITNSKALPTSIMPAGLVDQLTDQEIRDLLAFLCSPR